MFPEHQTKEFSLAYVVPPLQPRQPRRYSDKQSGENLCQCHFPHHISQMEWPRTETAPPRREAGD